MKIENLYNDYFRDIYRYIYKMCADEELATEITQQTFFKAMHSLSKFRGECDVKIWLLRIAKNLFYSHKKYEKRFVQMPIDLPSEHSIESEVEDKDETARILQALNGLKEPYKEIFIMRVFAELPFEDIGAAFGKNAHWACVTYHRAKEKIKQITED